MPVVLERAMKTSYNDFDKESKALFSNNLPPRFGFIDGLRGVASLLVVFFHMEVMFQLNDRDALSVVPNVIQQLMSHGDIGVQIFFTLSGFVIAHSLRELGLFSRYAEFLCKRMVRLCPAYWAVLVMIFFGSKFMGDSTNISTTMYKTNWLDLLSSMFYCQHILITRTILGPAWTLCSEMGFYIGMSVLLCVVSKFIADKWRAPTVVLTMFVIGLLQVNYASLSGWTLFCCGYLCYAKISNAKYSSVFFALLAVLLAVACTSFDLKMFVGGATAFVIYGVFVSGLTNKILVNKPIQYLGKISYSLYLVNINVCALLSKLASKFSDQTVLSQCAWLILSAAACIVAADLLYRFVEKPSHLAAKKLKLKFRS